MITPNLQKLLDALRSGEYQQTQECLTRRAVGGGGGVHCCLGVGSKLAADEMPQIRVSDFTESVRISYDGQEHYMPLSAAEWLGVPVVDWGGDGYDLYAISPEDGSKTKASVLNDNLYTFPQIADAIEAYYKDND